MFHAITSQPGAAFGNAALSAHWPMQTNRRYVVRVSERTHLVPACTRILVLQWYKVTKYIYLGTVLEYSFEEFVLYLSISN